MELFISQKFEVNAIFSSACVAVCNLCSLMAASFPDKGVWRNLKCTSLHQLSMVSTAMLSLNIVKSSMCTYFSTHCNDCQKLFDRAFVVLCSLCIILLTALCNHAVCFPSNSLRTVHRAHCAMCKVHCAMCTMCNVHCAHCAMCNVHCAHCVMCTVHTVQCAMCTIVQLVYNLTHCVLCTISRQRRLMQEKCN